MPVPPTIEHYEFGSITVDGEAHAADLIILPQRVIGGWWRREGHALHREDLGPVFDAQPDLLVVGTGASGAMRIPEETRRALKEAGIRLIAAPTAEAVETYNGLRGGERVAAALHLTC
jgi:hypothetical protein